MGKLICPARPPGVISHGPTRRPAPPRLGLTALALTKLAPAPAQLKPAIAPPGSLTRRNDRDRASDPDTTKTLSALL